MTTRSPIMAAINATADDPSVTVSVPIPLAHALITLVGGERGHADNEGGWTFPDGWWCWETDEALRYALEVTPELIADMEGALA